MEILTAGVCRYDCSDRSWCNCSSHISGNRLRDRLKCNCGEEWKIFEWNWEYDISTNNVVLSNQNRDVLFHPVYSSGTAAVRGDKQLKSNIHYYWEIKILSNLYGTDIMIGVGTSKVLLSDWKLRFCSMLGYDSESWGFSYTGKIQHGQLTRDYGSRFSLGSLIGVHLDMCAGTLEYYLNRKPLGIAFRGLKHYELYPMVCSTAAQSAMRITCAVSQVPTLQIECLKVISNNIKLLKRFWSIPGLPKMISKKYFWLVPELPAEKHDILELEDQMVLPVAYFDRNYTRRKRFCAGLHLNDPRADPDHITYRQLLNAKCDSNKAASKQEHCTTCHTENKLEDKSDKPGFSNTKKQISNENLKSNDATTISKSCLSDSDNSDIE